MEVAAGITMIDTRLWGLDGLTASYLVGGTQPALVETGAQTSVPTLLAGLRAAGLGPHDLAWIVLTHVHLDHCGGVGDLVQEFPKATVVVHERGAPHLVDPTRLVTGSAAVYGMHMPKYGGLTAVDEGRIMVVPDGGRISLGASRELRFVDAPGHARHQMAVVDESSGTVMAGDALGVQLPGGGMYPAIPPPEFDLDQAIDTLHRLADLQPETLLLGHFGPVDDPLEAIDLAIAQQSTAGDAAWSAWTEVGAEGIADAVNRALPLDDAVRDPAALEIWARLGWAENNVGGLTRWAERRAAATA